ncbi:MAG: hypothetical protein HY812_20745 [Planctomycetes bacterium]|nr:hypothetical protein [Planctomycetota bacterium]
MKRLLGRLLLVLFGAAIAVKACDLLVGWIDPCGISHFQHKRAFEEQSLRACRVSEAFSLPELIPGVVTEAGCRYAANSLGFRDEETTQKKPPNTFRIVVLGDSVTFGWGVEAAERFTDIVEAELAARALSGPRIEILNLGVPGYEATHQAAVFEQKALALEPDAVLFVFNFNDVHFLEDESYLLQRGFDGRLEERGFLARWLAGLLMESHVRTGLHALLPHLTDYSAYLSVFALLPGDDALLRDIYAHMQDGIEIAAGLYEKAWRLGAERGVKVAVLDLYDFQPIAAQCRARNVPYASMCFDGFTSDLSLRNSPSDPHPNARCHALLAERFEQALRDLCLLPEVPR